MSHVRSESGAAAGGLGRDAPGSAWEGCRPRRVLAVRFLYYSLDGQG